jgi:homoserine O-succinyltransferase/O-acetyltransferase
MAVQRLGPRFEQQPSRHPGAPIVIGLVNNMPDSALRRTEQQFYELLSRAAGGLAVRMRCFCLPRLPREPAGRLYVRERYSDVEQLMSSSLDGLIVTGMEPVAAHLRDEPYWPALADLVDWAEHHTASTIWSCLAAHAAVDYLDGINRLALGKKLSGLFEGVKVTHHPVLRGFPARWRIPHSRRNGLSEAALVASGYRILTRSPDAGVDMFLRDSKSLFLFFHGHPEYDKAALLREYRRDVGRFLAGDRDSYPEMPCGYFCDETTAAMLEFRESALQKRDVGVLASFPFAEAQQNLACSWHATAEQLFANWLSYLAERKFASPAGADPVVWHEEQELTAAGA